MSLGKALAGQDILLGVAWRIGSASFSWRGSKASIGLAQCSFDAASLSWSKAVPSAAATIGRSRPPTRASAPTHDVHAAALDGRAEHLGGGRLQPLVAVGDDRTGAAQAAVGQ